MITHEPSMSIRAQCRLLGLDRSGLYSPALGPDPEELMLCHRLDALYTAHPYYGVRRMTVALRREGLCINPKRVRRLLRQMGLLAIYPRPRLSLPSAGAPVYPYLLRDLSIQRVHQVWATDITYVRLREGYAYLVAMLEWHSRYVLSWQLAPSLETHYCLRALEQAIAAAGRAAEICNSDQGSQFTSREWIEAVQAAGMRVSHDGRGRALDNVMVERLWRSVKYEDIYLRDYGTLGEARAGLAAYFEFYNHQRPHQGLDYRTPAEVMKANPTTEAEGAGHDPVSPVPFASFGGEQKTTPFLLNPP